MKSVNRCIPTLEKVLILLTFIYIYTQTHTHTHTPQNTNETNAHTHTTKTHKCTVVVQCSAVSHRWITETSSQFLKGGVGHFIHFWWFVFFYARWNLELGNISILYLYCDMRLDIVLDFGYRNIVIWQKCCLFLVLKTTLQ